MKAHGELTYCPDCGKEVYPAREACVNCEIKKYKVEHINTGCLYEADGQKITIAHSGNESHFFDHSRMIDGTVEEGGLSAMKVIHHYVKGNYTPIKMEPYSLRYEFQKFYKSADFKDVSPQYRTMIRIISLF